MKTMRGSHEDDEGPERRRGGARMKTTRDSNEDDEGLE